MHGAQRNGSTGESVWIGGRTVIGARRVETTHYMELHLGSACGEPHAVLCQRHGA